MPAEFEHSVDRVGDQQAAQAGREQGVGGTAERHNADETHGDGDEGNVHHGIADRDDSASKTHRAVGNVGVDHQDSQHREGADGGD